MKDVLSLIIALELRSYDSFVTPSFIANNSLLKFILIQQSWDKDRK